jgi:hypothetical protein
MWLSLILSQGRHVIIFGYQPGIASQIRFLSYLASLFKHIYTALYIETLGFETNDSLSSLHLDFI